MTLEQVLERLEGVKKGRGNSYIALCPGHPDKNPSLSVKQGDKGVVVKCFAGCDTQCVCAGMGLSLADLFEGEIPKEAPAKKEAGPPWTREVESYEYTNAHGQYQYDSVRLHTPKDFRVKRKIPGSKDVWSIGDVKPVPYHLPRLIEGVAKGARVFLVEGETDVHAIESLGGYATTNHGGASSWSPAFHSPWLDGKSLITIIADRDREDKGYAGQKRAESIKIDLESRGTACEIVYARFGKDSRDHVEAGFGLLDWSPYVSPFVAESEPEPEPPKRFKIYSPSDLWDMEEKPMLIKDLIGVQDRWMLFGPPGCGKTFTVLDLMVCCAVGGTWATTFDCVRPMKVLYCTSEGKFGIPARLKANLSWNELEMADIEDNLKIILEVPQVFNTKGDTSILNLADELAQGGFIPDVIVIDTLNKAALGSGENDNGDAAIVCHNIAAVNDKLGCSVGLIHHSGWDGDRPRGASAYFGDMDLMLGQKMDEDAKTGLISLYKGKDITPFSPMQYEIVPRDASAAIDLTRAGFTPSDNTIAAILATMAEGDSGLWWSIAALKEKLKAFDPERIRNACKREDQRDDSRIEWNHATRPAMYRLKGSN